MFDVALLGPKIAALYAILFQKIDYLTEDEVAQITDCVTRNYVAMQEAELVDN